MKTILSNAKMDDVVKGAVSAPTATVAVAGMAVLPSLVAEFYLGTISIFISEATLAA